MIQDYYTKVKSSDDIVILSHLLLQNESKRDVQILNRFSSKASKGIVTDLSVESLDLDLIYSSTQLKAICAKNHFKLLHTSETDVKLTTQEIRVIKNLEERYDTSVKSYFLLSSHELNDSFSMLFCRLSNGCYYKITERDMPVNKIKAVVLRSSMSLIMTLLAIVGLFALVGSLFSMTVVIACVSTSAIISLFTILNNKWHKQITSRTWEQV